jgi:uncharacterized protein YxjI
MKYLLRKKILTFIGKEFSILNDQQQIVAYAKQKAFKLKEEIVVTADKEQQNPLLQIKARNILDFHATYDVTDARTGEKFGALRRMGMKSILRDEWEILGENDQVLGVVQEESMLMALVRRLLMNFIPQKYDLRIGEQDAGGFLQQFNFFTYVLEIDVDESLLNKNMAFAMAILLGAIEGKQE